LGNKNNPPDFIVKQGVAVEVKKIENVSFGKIVLNSSYPKDYLYSDSSLITRACGECEDEYGGWDRKNMVYAIGNVIGDRLKMLWLLYGNCYAADRHTYERIKDTIGSGITQIEDVEFSETRELDRVNKVDPLGITGLRVRGLWSVKHPMMAFDYLVGDYSPDGNYQFYALMLRDTYCNLPTSDIEQLNCYIDKGVLERCRVEIECPNNPVKCLDAVFLKRSCNVKR
jgi:hypothetical protein